MFNPWNRCGSWFAIPKNLPPKKKKCRLIENFSTHLQNKKVICPKTAISEPTSNLWLELNVKIKFVKKKIVQMNEWVTFINILHSWFHRRRFWNINLTVQVRGNSDCERHNVHQVKKYAYWPTCIYLLANGLYYILKTQD